MKKYYEVYTEIYKPTCNANNIDCWRVDELTRPGSITKDIVEGIIDADIIIADLTSKNPNVFYELGVAHSTGNKTIMTAQNEKDVPFDIVNYRIIFYEQTIKGSEKFKELLDLAIKDLLIALDRTNNPIQDVLSTRSSLAVKRKTPLSKLINVSFLPKRMREWLLEKNIHCLEDLNNINFEELGDTPGIGKDSLERFISSLINHDLWHDPVSLQKFIIKKNLHIDHLINK